MTRKRNLVQAVGYVRTSSAANIGRDKDSERRQRLAIERFAKSAGYAVVDWFNDPAVSGADPIESRPGFAALLNRIEGNGVRVVLVEDASRFARDLMAQELGHGRPHQARDARPDRQRRRPDRNRRPHEGRHAADCWQLRAT